MLLQYNKDWYCSLFWVSYTQTVFMLFILSRAHTCSINLQLKTYTNIYTVYCCLSKVCEKLQCQAGNYNFQNDACSELESLFQIIQLNFFLLNFSQILKCAWLICMGILLWFLFGSQGKVQHAAYIRVMWHTYWKLTLTYFKSRKM